MDSQKGVVLQLGSLGGEANKILHNVTQDCIHLDQDRDQWMALVNTAMKLQVPLMVGNFTE
jgi:hypothetical protein